METNPPKRPTPPAADIDFREILDSVDANIWEADASTLRRDYVSHYAEVLLGYTREEWMKPGFWQSVVHSEDRERVVSDVLRRAQLDDAFEEVYRLVAADRRVLWVRDLVHVRRADGGARRLLGVMIDETRLHEAAEALRSNEQRLRAIFESAKDFGIFTMDLEGRVMDWNPGASNIFGYQASEVIGKPASIIFTPEDLQRGVDQLELRRALLVGRSVDERWHLKKSGERIWCSGLMMALRDERDQITGLMKILRDTTEQMLQAEAIRSLNTELELRVVERTSQLESANRELEAFSYSVSHDLHAPLRKIDGYSRMVAEEFGARLDERGRDYLEKIRAGTQSMSRLIDDMLSLARVSRGSMRAEPIDLGAIAEEIADDLGKAWGRNVKFKIAKPLPAAGDRPLLRVALYNLLENACKFASKTAAPVVELGRLAGVPPVFFVRDNGAGFDMAQSGKLFREFSRLHSPEEFTGTGIGLATAQRVIGRHGGRIWAEGKVGKGATFFFTLEKRP